eukprot:CAMPEP_0203914780 /NCGR_PEP_ID=MMETSP0359-20131031/55646_1 /ASSEMBLY_ACC=CAM_ASM_000338 /TAXON_ID=268821 /ORGANISM="Scrippsiella Hangoei, Strain SHTV-5" /LENGTH=304 /DNA_ID=CAMNT_0050841155 /DNA_START=1 /DNA_END=912 /DNA_ORIENTATION=-
MDIILPEGYQCKMVLKTEPRGDGDDKIALATLPADSPTGNGGLPASTTFEGGNLTTPGAGYRSGRWEFDANRCTFHFDRFMTVWENSRLYLNIFVLNPALPLPRNDPSNRWIVNFTSSGEVGAPSANKAPCFPYNPPLCYETGETYYVNPLGQPQASFEPLYPSEGLSVTVGPYETSLPLDLIAEPNYTTSFAVLGILEDLVVQPNYFHLGARNKLQIWFRPDLGNHERDGFLGIQGPAGFDFGDPCVVRDLPQSYYSIYSPPFGGSGIAPWKTGAPRIFPIEDLGDCSPQPSPSWSRGGSYVT